MDTLLGLTFFGSFYVFTATTLSLTETDIVASLAIAGVVLLASVLCGWYLFLSHALRASDQLEPTDLRRRTTALLVVVLGNALLVALPAQLALPSADLVQQRAAANTLVAIVTVAQFFLQAYLVAKMRAYEVVACSTSAQR